MSDEETGARVRWRMHFMVPPEKVFAVLDSDQGRASFWAESAVEQEGTIEFHFINGIVCRSRVLERRPPELFVIDWRRCSWGWRPVSC